MAAEDVLRRYLEQRRELGERELVLDDMSVDDVMRILGAKATAKPAREEPVIAQRRPETRDREVKVAETSGDWREALRAAEAEEGQMAKSKTSKKAQPPAAKGSDAPGGLVVGSNDREIFGGPVSEADSLEEIVQLVAKCKKCPLYKTATNPVPGEGNPKAELMCVGEAPGANEDATGRPFVGQAGQLLTKILGAINLTREEVFIANVLKHRPPGNRNPHPDEVAACRPYLSRQIELVRPKVIIAFGTFAAQTLLETKLAIGKLRGSVHKYHGVPLIVTYHPAALLRNPAWKRPTWEDVQLARRLLDNATA